MHIEFHTPAGEVKEWLLQHMKEQLVELHHYEPAISRAQVYFRYSSDRGNVVEVDIPTFGTSLFIHRTSDSYEQAMREVMEELSSKVMERYNARNEPSDEVISTVEVEQPSDAEEGREESF